jgi:hypothetical protein
MPRQLPSPSVVPGPLKERDLPSIRENDETHPACPTLHRCRPELTILCRAPFVALPSARPTAILNPIKSRFVAIALLTTLLSGIAAAQQPAKADQDNSQDSGPDAHSKMNERGEKGMGFSQTATTHHFFLKADGGVIQVEANDPKDTATRDAIRMHLTHIAHAFASGDFDIPMLVHDTVPPGVPDMKRLSKRIAYSFEQTPNGGRVMIATSDSEARAAIHKYLRFQIDEHKTHDPTQVH